jgi:hypothetical protein
MNYLKRFLVDFFVVLGESKKAKALLVALAVLLASKLGWNVSDTTVLSVLGLFGSYILGQGLADSGKEAAKLIEKNRSDAPRKVVVHHYEE